MSLYKVQFNCMSMLIYFIFSFVVFLCTIYIYIYMWHWNIIHWFVYSHICSTAKKVASLLSCEKKVEKVKYGNHNGSELYSLPAMTLQLWGKMLASPWRARNYCGTCTMQSLESKCRHVRATNSSNQRREPTHWTHSLCIQHQTCDISSYFQYFQRSTSGTRTIS